MAFQCDPEEMDTHDEEFLGIQPEPMECHCQEIRISENQIKNPAGGFVFTTTQETQLQRFLCLGASCNGYRTGNRGEFKLEDVKFILQSVGDGYGKKLVDFLTDFSTNCRSFKQDPTLYTLALCCRSSDEVTKHAAFAAVQKVCRTPTHLFRYLDYCQKISRDLTSSKGWGRGLRKAVCDWYLKYGSSERNLMLLALHLTKYTKRYGWRHRQAIRLAHLKVEGNPALKYLIIVARKGKRYTDSTSLFDKLKKQEKNNETHLKAVADLLDGIERAKKTGNVNVITDLILKHRLVRENVPSFFLNEKQVWLALSRHMPMTALIRNLGKMSNLDIFLQENQRSDKEESFEETLILGKLQNRELILKEKVHPVIFLKAINQYKKGHNSSEKTKWNVLPQICTALENGFYLSFENVRPTGKRFLIAVEISQSMKEEIQVPGTFSLRAIDVAAFMVTLAARTEQHSDVVVFSSETPKPLFIQSTATIDDVNARIQQIADNTHNQASDASWVFKYALQEKKRYDAIVIYTDSTSCKGYPHPMEALKMYREAAGREDVRLVVCNLSCTDFSIGDREDQFTMTICGFDSHCPQIIMNFVHGIL